MPFTHFSLIGMSQVTVVRHRITFENADGKEETLPRIGYFKREMLIFVSWLPGVVRAASSSSCAEPAGLGEVSLRYFLAPGTVCLASADRTSACVAHE